MTDPLTVALKVSLVVFMAGNLLDMGLKLDVQQALRGLRDWRFVAHTLLWSWVLGPAVAWAITRLLPLAEPYAIGLVLLGMTPCAPFLPGIVAKGGGDLGYTAAFMLLTAAATVVFMPLAVPVMLSGLTVTAWSIARPLAVVVLLPLAVGMVLLRVSAGLAGRLGPVVKKATQVATLAVIVLCLLVYGEGLVGVRGSLAVAAQAIFFSVVTTFTYWLGFGLQPDRKIVLSAGMATRNLGAALAPLFSVAGMDERAIIMVVLGLPIMAIFALLSVRWFGRPAPAPQVARG